MSPSTEGKILPFKQVEMPISIRYEMSPMTKPNIAKNTQSSPKRAKVCCHNRDNNCIQRFDRFSKTSLKIQYAKIVLVFITCIFHTKLLPHLVSIPVLFFPLPFEHAQFPRLILSIITEIFCVTTKHLKQQKVQKNNKY